MNFTEKLGLLERGLKRRVENYPKYFESGEREKAKVQAVIDEFQKMIDDYKGDYAIRKQLQKDETLIKMAGSKSKLKKLLEDETAFVAMIESGRDEFKKNYQQEQIRIDILLENARESLPDAEYLLQRIAHNDYDEKLVESLINLFLIPVLTDWRDFEQDQEKKQENIQDSE